MSVAERPPVVSSIMDMLAPAQPANLPARVERQAVTLIDVRTVRPSRPTMSERLAIQQAAMDAEREQRLTAQRAELVARRGIPCCGPHCNDNGGRHAHAGRCNCRPCPCRCHGRSKQ